MIELRQQVVNYLDLRWSDDFAPVSQAFGELADAFEQLAASSSPARHQPRFEVTSIQLHGHALPVGVVRFDLHLSSGSRELRFFHAVAFPSHDRLTESAWRALVEDRYGGPPEAAIRELYERAADLPRSKGGFLAERLFIRDADVRVHLGPPSPAGAVSERTPRTQRTIRSLRWMLGVALVLLLVQGAFVLLGGRSGTGKQGAGSDEVLKLRLELQRLEGVRDTIEAQRVDLDRRLQARTNELSECEIRANQACDGLLTDLDKARGEVEALGRARDELVRVRDGLSSRLTQSQAAVTTAQRERDTAQSKLTITENALSAALGRLDKTIDERNDKDLEIIRGERKIEELRDALRNACGRIGSPLPSACKRIP